MNKYERLFRKQIDNYTSANTAYDAALKELENVISATVKGIVERNAHDDMNLLRRSMPPDCIISLFLIDIQENEMKPNDDIDGDFNVT